MPSSRYVDRIKVGAVRIALFAFNVVSLTGGLLALGRWSRARWFSAALVFLAFVDWSGEKLAWQLLAAEDHAYEMYGWHFYLHISYIILVIAVASTASFAVLASSPEPRPSHWVIAVTVAASVLAVAATYYTFPLAKHQVALHLRQGGIYVVLSKSDKEYERAKLHKSIALANPTLWGNMSFPVLPGSTEIKGVVRFDGRPTTTSVKLYLNDFWRTGTIRTNEDGEFLFRVALKNPEINRIRMDLWFQKPETGRDYMPILNTPILRFEGSFFDDAQYSQRIQVDSGARVKGADIMIDIVEFIEMVWPKIGEIGQMGSLEDGFIEWLPVPGASYYQVAFSQYRGEKGAISHLKLRVGANQIPLSTLPVRESTSATSYYVVVTAFDKGDRFLSSSKSAFTHMSFSIPGHVILRSSPVLGE